VTGNLEKRIEILYLPLKFEGRYHFRSSRRNGEIQTDLRGIRY